MKLRLLLTEECNHNCDGCCNKDWDLSSLPTVQDFNGYDQILITGGEPMLYPSRIIDIIKIIRKTTNTEVYIYTADVRDTELAKYILSKVDGFTVTLHSQSDVRPFLRFCNEADLTNKSMRLNVFSGIDFPGLEYINNWEIKKDMKWIKNCPLPKDEVFMKAYDRLSKQVVNHA